MLFNWLIYREIIRHSVLKKILHFVLILSRILHRYINEYISDARLYQDAVNFFIERSHHKGQRF